MEATCEGCDRPGLAKTIEHSLEVSSHVFTAELPGIGCAECGRVTVDKSAFARFELVAASQLADAGVSTGDAFGFMKRTLGLADRDLARLLSTTEAEIARWEHNDFVYRSAVETLAALLRDRLAGKPLPDPAALQDLLVASYRSPRPLAKAVRLGPLALVGT